MPKQTPRPIQLGSIAKAYTDELAEHGEDAMNKRAEETMDMILERFRNTPLTLVSWADIRQVSHDTWCSDGVCHCPPPPLRQRVVAFIRRIFS